MKKLTAIFLAIIMVFSLAACGAQGEKPATQTDVNAAPEVTLSPEEEAMAAEMKAMFERGYAKYAPETVVMTVNGQEVVWADYYSWIYNIVSQIITYYGKVDWNTEIESGLTFNDWVKEYSEVSTSQYVSIEQGAKAAGVEITEADRAEIMAAYESDVQKNGGTAEDFFEMLAQMYITENYYFYMGEISYYYNNFFKQVFGENGEKVSDEDVYSFAEDNGYLRAKHILFKTVDDNQAPLDEAAKAQKLADAEAALAELKACASEQERLAKFDELIKAKGEDTGSLIYPDGYYFTDGEMVPEFENGTKALEMNQISDIVESSYGYHIILRLPIEPDNIVDAQYGVSLRAATASSLYGKMIEDLTINAEIAYQNGFDNLDLAVIFE